MPFCAEKRERGALDGAALRFLAQIPAEVDAPRIDDGEEGLPRPLDRALVELVEKAAAVSGAVERCAVDRGVDQAPKRRPRKC